MKVSVILLNYNYAQYLDESIQSILAQTYQDFELIIIDNGSTDDSLQIINKYKDSRIRRIIHPENNRFFYQRWNEGADLAQGEYVLFYCSDDYCHPILLEQLVKTLDKYPSVGLAYTQSWEVDDQGNKLSSFRTKVEYLNRERWNETFIDNGSNECKYLFSTCTIANIGAALIRRELFFRAGMFDKDMPFSADWMFYAKLFTISDIAFISEHLNFCRTHGISMRKTNKDDAFLEERLRVLDYLFNTVEPPTNFLEDVFYPTLGWWLRVVLSGKMPLGRIQRTYKILRGMDSSIDYRIIRYFSESVRNKINKFLAAKFAY